MQEAMPPELLRRYDVVFKPLSKSKPIPMRQIGAEHVGRIVSVQVKVASTAPAALLSNIASLVHALSPCAAFHSRLGSCY